MSRFVAQALLPVQAQALSLCRHSQPIHTQARRYTLSVITDTGESPCAIDGKLMERTVSVQERTRPDR
jgi:hypothetical protein